VAKEEAEEEEGSQRAVTRPNGLFFFLS